MLPSAETCKRWKERKFVRQPHRMVIGLIVCVLATIYALVTGQAGAAKLFGWIGAFFLVMYALANYIVWKAEQLE
jgi:ATP/ADP translocase